MQKKIILTGDRPTGPLHLGHYVGSLKARVELQNEYDTYILIADMQALTDNADNPEKIRKNVLEVALDYLSVGINPKISTIAIQSELSALCEIAMYFLNLVTLARLERNPTVKGEMKQKGFGNNVPAGFLTYPVSQAADITAFKADLVPVGEDQLPMIEQTAEIVRRFNKIYPVRSKTSNGAYKPILVEPKALVSKFSRLPGIEGKSKMSKSLGNAIYLSDSADAVAKKVMAMYTDPKHIHVENKGKVEGNVVFTYLDAFDPDTKAVEDFKRRYRAGGLGDVVIKTRLINVLEKFLRPIRERRAQFEKEPQKLIKILKDGTAKAKIVTSKTLTEIKKAMHLDYF